MTAMADLTGPVLQRGQGVPIISASLPPNWANSEVKETPRKAKAPAKKVKKELVLESRVPMAGAGKLSMVPAM